MAHCYALIPTEGNGWEPCPAEVDEKGLCKMHLEASIGISLGALERALPFEISEYRRRRMFGELAVNHHAKMARKPGRPRKEPIPEEIPAADPAAAGETLSL